MPTIRCPLLRLSIFALLALPFPAAAQQITPNLYGDMRWRTIGPFRGGRTVAATGVPGHPSLFYVAANNGGVWKTNDYGRTWTPIFDDQPTGSIGALAVAPSNPRTIYVGSGEGLQRPDLFDRRRHLQVNRRRQDLAAPGAPRWTTDRRYSR